MVGRRIGRSGGVLDDLAEFWSIGRRIGRSGGESSGERDGRAAYRTVWLHFVRSDGELDGRAANQAANWTVGRRFDRSGVELDGRAANQAANWTVGRRIGRSGGILDGLAAFWTIGRRIGRYSEDVNDKKHERLSPSQSQASRPEYKMFRHRIYQEIRRQKFIFHSELHRRTKSRAIPGQYKLVSLLFYSYWVVKASAEGLAAR
jgi:hypothetical protein